MIKMCEEDWNKIIRGAESDEQKDEERENDILVVNEDPKHELKQVEFETVELPKKLREKQRLKTDKVRYEVIRGSDIDGEAVGKRIYILRKGKGLTIEEFGAIIGYCKSSIWSWEYGKRLPSLDAVKKMCLLFGCSADFLIFGTGRSGWEI